MADFLLSGFGPDLVDARPGVVGGVDDALDLARRVDFLRFFFASGAEARSGVLGRGAPSGPGVRPGRGDATMECLSEARRPSRLRHVRETARSPREETDASARRALTGI